MSQLDRFARSNALAGKEWTSSVYRNPANGPNKFDELEAVLIGDGAVVDYDRVYLAVQHPFRCAALPSN
jgi:phage baseplate assembly protein gpV